MSQHTTVYHPKIKKLIHNIQNVMIGKEEVTTLSIVALLAEGHVLLEDVPGVGKTMLVRSLAKSVASEFKRIQFTPDLLPSDVVGVSIYNPQDMQFEFRPGPILGNIVLADEINRTSPKTQSSLLEGMEEKSVTVDGNTVQLSKPFFVMATQNPIEYEGTYPLPEAQLDRFLLKLNMGYPTFEEEVQILERVTQKHPVDEIGAVMTREELLEAQAEVLNVYIGPEVQRYIVNLVTKTRNHPSIYLGVSPRGSIALMKAAKAYAYIQDRDYVLPDDVKYLAPFVLSHRVLLTSEARFGGVDSRNLVSEMTNTLSIPVGRGQ
ncbi:magnesium chelatase [Pontibacillus halophilus JSM 076056 = DSM 19796]|uniref:Magnesium chelatase n=1 Tax=Pontibacillus halophilus JSM 076056 = DSM 19796 TaxID=1385510 RepID=A0A0A5I0A7_9BACI|nr:MoxR family ATPase [Pontibacillus halophilus]KGX89287.1 magnesium chelatase [Pontibacillus halophilus JSM 076056 = DSM 19796]